jgi:hypothetical protein
MESKIVIHHSDEILPGLFLGNVASSQDWKFIEKNSIKCILTCCPRVQPKFSGKLTYKVLELEDAEEQSILEHLDDSFEFIDSGLSQVGVSFQLISARVVF